MNASNLYISTCRLVLKADPEDHASWTDLDTLLPNLRLALSCNVCGKLLHEPYSPSDKCCEQHICKNCLGSQNTIRPSSSCCKDHQMYRENKQLQIILLCYKKICEFLRISPIYRKIIEVVNDGGSHDLLNTIDETTISAVEPRDKSSIVNDVYRTLALNESEDKCLENAIENSNSELLSENKAELSLDSVEPFLNSSNGEIYDKFSGATSSNEETEIADQSEPVIEAVCRAEEEDDSNIENAPVLSPIKEQSENTSSEELIPTPNLSPVHPLQLQSNHSYQLDIDVVLSKNSDGDEKYDREEELLNTSNFTAETNSEISSISSVSSPLEISPALPSQEESPDDALQETLDEFHLAASLTSTSVLELQSSPDLIDANQENVLDSLDDDGSYGDLADINLSSCPLTSLGDEAIKDEIISISDSVLSLQPSISPITQVVKDQSIFQSVTPKYEIDNSELIVDVSSHTPQISNSNICNYSLPQSILPKTSEICSLTNSSISQPLNQITLSSLYTPQSLGNQVNRNSSNITVIPSPSNILSNSILHSQIPSQFSQSTPTSTFIRPNINSHVITSPLLSPNNIRSGLLSPLGCPVSTNSVCHGLPTQLIQTPMSSPNVVPASLLSNQVIQQSITSHHILQKTITSNQLIPKPLPQPTLNNPSVSACHIVTNNMVVNQLAANNIQTPRMFLNAASPITSLHQTYQTALSQPKFHPANQSPSNNVAFTTNSTTHGSSSLSSSFLNILPAGTIFHSPGLQNKSPNKETQMKNTPNGSSMYSVMFSEGDSTKITIKRTPPDTKPLLANPNLNVNSQPIRHDHVPGVHVHNSHINQNLIKKPLKPKTKPKPKPKRKGCRCGNATPSPGKLTCCGQRCPCYVEAKACIECRCKGCRNPHRPGGMKVRPVIPHQANIQIHQIQPIHARVVAGVSNAGNSMIPVVTGLQQSQSFPPQHLLHTQNTTNPTSLDVTSSQTIRTLHAIHSVKALPGVNPIHGITTADQLLNVKECVIDNTIHSSISQESMIPVSNIISMKPIKVRLDSISNQFIKTEKIPHSADSDSTSDLDIDE